MAGRSYLTVSVTLRLLVISNKLDLSENFIGLLKLKFMIISKTHSCFNKWVTRSQCICLVSIRVNNCSQVGIAVEFLVYN